MRTEVVAIDRSVLGGEELVEATFGCLVIFEREESPGNARLVCYHQHSKVSVRQLSDGLSDSGEEPNLSGIADVPCVVDDGPVAVEKDGRAAAHEMSACSIARATTGKLSSGRVRGSSSTRSAETRTTTGGSPSRSRSASPSGPSGPASRATSVVGSTAPGNEPPPTADSPGSVRAPTAAGHIEASRDARWVSSPCPTVSMARTGIAEIATSGS